MFRPFTRITLASSLAIGLIATGAGISAATIAQKAPTAAMACLDSHGGLVVPTKDSCAKGLTVTHLPLSTTKGARGRVGAQGPQGLGWRPLTWCKSNRGSTT
jgi:hypothetical protein